MTTNLSIKSEEAEDISGNLFNQKALIQSIIEEARAHEDLPGSRRYICSLRYAKEILCSLIDNHYDSLENQEIA